MEETKIQGIESGRAKFAWKCAKDGEKISTKKDQIDGEWYEDKNYKSYVKRLPELIKTNGLGAALAFIFSKRQKDSKKPKNAYDLIYKQIGEWLSKEDNKHLWSGCNNSGELIEKIISCNSFSYRALTIEVLAFLNWLKRFAEGLIEDQTGEKK
ncbi:MAG TPA: type III-B CRISPR module-associated protein Cmr5 [Candidatus Desulfofervidus auxilii]|uniref:CRISPR type III-B/RAMP module-associated protein Cmr5 n=1 Tax=Desulfofervidus auxilii TaxID=1621989 RepID=A0A7V0IAG6_DESA2|nr:type III-B CRISPR module-associated protein Cmr5 [Candidatus Desulfofervidus auxilii]